MTFQSKAANLGVPANARAVLLRSMATPGAEIISRADGAAGAPAGRFTNGGSISGDGTCATFSAAGAPVPLAGISPDFEQVFVRVLSRECPKDPPETSISGPSGSAADRQRRVRLQLGRARLHVRVPDRGLRARSRPARRRCSAPACRTARSRVEVRATDPAGITDPTPATATVTIAVPPVIRSFTVSRARFRVGPGATGDLGREAGGRRP